MRKSVSGRGRSMMGEPSFMGGLILGGDRKRNPSLMECRGDREGPIDRMMPRRGKTMDLGQNDRRSSFLEQRKAFCGGAAADDDRSKSSSHRPGEGGLDLAAEAEVLRREGEQS